jgi:Galactose oxidase, central domain
MEIRWPTVAHHTITAVYASAPKSLSTGNSKVPRGHQIILEKSTILEGLYIFGGTYDGGKTASNSLLIINTQAEPWSYFEEVALGTAPEPRMNHCAHWIPSLSGIVIYGGRNPRPISSDEVGTPSFCVDSMYLLDLTVLCWMSIKIKGESPPLRHSFCSFIHGRLQT